MRPVDHIQRSVDQSPGGCVNVYGFHATFLLQKRSIHTKRLRYESLYVEGHNGYATHCVPHNDNQKTIGAARQCYGDGDGVTRCGWTLNS